MSELPPPSVPPAKKKNPVYRLADWFERCPHYGAGFIALVVILYLALTGTLGPLLDMFGGQ